MIGNKSKNIDFPVWHLANKQPGVMLYKSGDSHYIVTADGDWTPIIACGLFVIVNQSLLSFFRQHLARPLSFQAVSIYDRVLNQYFDGYYRIHIEDPITPDTLHSADSSGIKIRYHADSGGIFISRAMKSLLDESPIEGLTTETGFSRYGGADSGGQKK